MARQNMIFINPNARSNKDIPNIALAYAATHFNVQVVDLNTKHHPFDRIFKYEPDIVGISVQSRTLGEAVRIANIYKSKRPKVKVKSLSGFLDIQCCYPYMDFEDKILYEKPFSDDYPFPNYELFDSFEIFKKRWQRGIWDYALITSQGCPYQCIYCTARNRKPMWRSPENCYEELKMAKERWGIKSFQVIDDCFNFSKRRVLEFCGVIQKLKMNWLCTNGLRADKFDEDIAKALHKSGCKQVSFGIESTAPEVLEAIKKGENMEQVEKAIDIAKRYFKNINGFFIIGLPMSSYKIDLNSIEWVLKRKIKAHFSYYVPFNKGMEYNRLFFGKGTCPVSNEYPKELQKRVYQLTGYMRSDVSKIEMLKNFLTSIASILLFDIPNLLKHASIGFKVLMNGLEQRGLPNAFYYR